MDRTERLPARPEVAAWTPGVVYGLALLASGWILGPLRVLLVEPVVGPFGAVFVEAPLMIAITVLITRWLDRHNWIGRRRREQAAMGLIGASLVLVGEGGGALLMTGDRGGLNIFITPEGLIGLLLVGIAALTPLILLSWPTSPPRLR